MLISTTFSSIYIQSTPLIVAASGPVETAKLIGLLH